MLYIFLIAVLNLGLGFAVAWHLGGRCRRPAVSLGEMPLVIEDPVDLIATEEPEVEAETPEEVTLVDDAEPEADTAEDEEEKTPSRVSVEAFQAVVGDYLSQLATVEGQLRDLADEPDVEEIKTCLQSLRESGREYLSRRDESHESFREVHEACDGFEAIGRDVAETIEKQTAAVHDSICLSEEFDYEEDVAEGCRQAAVEIDNLFVRIERLRDALDAALAWMARTEERIESLKPSAAEDRLTGLPNRLGFESALLAWWKKDPHRLRKMTVAAVEIDEFHKVNQKYGHRLGDMALRAFGKLLASETGESGLVARFSGRRFLIHVPDEDAAFTIDLVERIRQLLETSHFQRNETDIHLAASCAVIASIADDTPPTLFARVNETIKEAKRSGRNRSFVHDGKKPTSVVPPNFTPTRKVIEL